MVLKDLSVVISTALLALGGGFIVIDGSTVESPQEPGKAEIRLQPWTPVKPLLERPERPSTDIEPEYVEVLAVSDKVREESLYADIMNRQANPYRSRRNDRNIDAHETTHGINNDLRNKYTKQLGKRVNGFYVTGGKGVIIEEPNIRKRAVIEFLPITLRSYRYDLYIAGQLEWDDVPLYLLDEWVSYVNGGAVSIEDVEKGRHNREWSDDVSGCLDFSIYCVALCMAIEKGDPDYWNNNKQFRNFMHWHLVKSHRIFMKGREMEEFRWDKQEKLLEALRNSEEGKPMKEFLNKHFNGVWLKNDPQHAPFLDAQHVPYLEPKQGNRNILEILRKSQFWNNHSSRMNFR